jgi:hypothetical protein
MESIAFFEKKIHLSPGEFNEVKHESIDSILEKKAKQLIENKCSEQGFVVPGTIKLISRSMGYFEAARFTGDANYYLKLEGKIVYPADGVRVICEVIRKNKMGLYADYNNAIRIQVPRDLHIGSEEYEEVDVGDIIEVELKRSKFQINDPYILASAIFITKKSGDRAPISEVSEKIKETEQEAEEETEDEAEAEEEAEEAEEAEGEEVEETEEAEETEEGEEAE